MVICNFNSKQSESNASIFGGMNEGVINIIGEIGKDVFLENVKSQFDSQPKAESFVVNIDSIGGDLFEGWEIYDYLKEKNVNTKGLGIVASVASLIFLAGKNREISAKTDFLIHYPKISNINEVNSKGLKVLSDIMKSFDSLLSEEYSKNTNLTQQEALDLMEKDDYIPSNKLLDYGFITKEALKLTAKATLNKDDMSKGKNRIKGLLEMIDEALTGTKVSNKMLYSAEQKEVQFPELDEEDTIEVGDQVRVDGETLTGRVEIVLADGRTIIVEDSVIVEIKEEEEEEDENDEQMAEMKTKVEALATQVEEMKIENKRLKEERNDFSDRLVKARETLKEIKEYGSKITAREERESKSRFTKVKKGGLLDDAFKNLNK